MSSACLWKKRGEIPTRPRAQNQTRIVTRHEPERPIGGSVVEPEGQLICRLTGAIRAALRLVLAAAAPHLPARVQEKHLKPHQACSGARVCRRTRAPPRFQIKMEKTSGHFCCISGGGGRTLSLRRTPQRRKRLPVRALISPLTTLMITIRRSGGKRERG